MVRATIKKNVISGLIAAINVVIVSSTFELSPNDECFSTMTQAVGVCVEPKYCKLFNEFKWQLNICSFNKTMPIVCCPLSGASRSGEAEKRKCVKKCDDYSKLSKINLRDTFGLENGVNRNFNEFPHASAIGLAEDGEIFWQCGGSLISEEFVLTAAHCALNKAESLIVRIGDKNLQRTDDGANPQEFRVKKIFIHPDYKRSIKYHDIALMQLNRKVELNKDVMPACLCYSNKIQERTAEDIGWGSTTNTGDASDVLINNNKNLVENLDCNRIYSADTYDIPKGIISSQLCASDSSRQRDKCQGDSGGPLQLARTVNNKYKYYEIIGITSFGRFCAAGSPGVYTRVSSYIDWIESIVWP